MMDVGAQRTVTWACYLGATLARRLHATAPVTSGVNHQLNRSRLDQSFVRRRRRRISCSGSAAASTDSHF